MRRIALWFVAAFVVLPTTPSWAGDEEGHEHNVLKVEDLPPPVQKVLKQEAQGGQVRDVHKEVERGKAVYEAEVINNGQGHDVKVSADGQVLKRGPAHDEDGEKAAGHDDE